MFYMCVQLKSDWCEEKSSEFGVALPFKILKTNSRSDISQGASRGTLPDSAKQMLFSCIATHLVSGVIIRAVVRFLTMN